MIELNEIRFSWSGQSELVLQIQALSVADHEKVFIKGPSGSGKTTLLNLIAGVLVPQSGTITVLNTPLKSLSSIRRDRFRSDHMGFIFQLFNLIPYLSVIENVTLPCYFSSRRMQKVLQRSRTHEEEARRLLSELNVGEELVHSPVTELSVGQQQRVAVARALIGGPEVVIADEPTSSLDTENREAFLKLLFQEVTAFDSTLIFVSHDPSLGQLFDRTLNLPELNRIPNTTVRR